RRSNGPTTISRWTSWSKACKPGSSTGRPFS
ncbi:hypothetical protein AK812_SmicGene47730, partial [Symbiodinium microadriaticum]